jgi:hypothetical protein
VLLNDTFFLISTGYLASGKDIELFELIFDIDKLGNMFVLIETEELYEQILLEFYLKLWI